MAMAKTWQYFLIELPGGFWQLLGARVIPGSMTMSSLFVHVAPALTLWAALKVKS
jgi:hypothetical protein